MFKSTSSNEQHRARGHEIRASNNEHGIDPSAFKSPPIGQLEDEYARLQRQYADAQMRLNEVKRHISAGQGRKRCDGTYVDRKVWSKWHDNKLAIAGELLEINTKLAELKRAIKQARQDVPRTDDNTFDACFKAMAKELLAGPVYGRLITATIHRLGERQESTRA
jgi:hypothetical protein